MEQQQPGWQNHSSIADFLTLWSCCPALRQHLLLEENICVSTFAQSHFQPNCWHLKGQCHEFFCFWFFSRVSFPPAQEYPIKTVSIFFKNSRRYSLVKVHHWYQQHRWQIRGCQRHRCRYQRHRRQICYRCQGHPAVVHLEPWIYTRIFEIIRNGRKGILRCLWETHSWKKPKVENLVALSL